MSDQEKPSRKTFYLAFWIIGLLIPLGAVILWDSMPRYKAVRQLREAGVEQVPMSVHEAIEKEDLDTVTLLHTAQVPLTGLNEEGKTPLISAIERNDEAIGTFLISQPDVDCDQADENGVSPLAHAISRGNLDTVKRLILRIQNPNITLKQDDQAEIHVLHKATQERDGTLLRLLLTHPNTDVNVRDADGKTPLHYAIMQEDLVVVEALLSSKNKPDPNIASTNDGQTPLDYAIASARPESVKLLLEHGAKPPIEKHVPYLISAIEQSDAETVRHLLAHEVSPDSKHPDTKDTLLNYAMDLSETGCVAEFLDAGARPSGTLRKAIQCGQGHGAQIVATHYHNHEKEWSDQEGLLEMAIYSGNPDCIDLLLNKGTDPNEYTSNGQRVLAMAIAARQDRVVKRLLELGADPNQRIDSPVSGEFLGFFEGDAKTLYYLRRDKDLTNLMLAALTEQQAVVNHLIDHGASRNAYSQRYRRYAVAFAAERHNVPIMQLILGREPNDRTRTVTINLSKQRATLFQDGKPVSSSRVSSGKRGNSTPKGTFVITNKHRHHNSSIYGSSMPYFMRLSCSDFGMHYSPSVPSYPASHGCVRMPWDSVKHFYSILQVGDIVTIE